MKERETESESESESGSEFNPWLRPRSDTDSDSHSGPQSRFPVVKDLFRAHHTCMNHWLVKQEPTDYSWDDLVKDGWTAWTGVRNFQARNNLGAMKKGDEVLFYHSGSGKEIVGVARVARTAYPDATATEGDWCCVNLMPVKALKRPVPLAEIKADAVLKEMGLVKQSRLSVMPVSSRQFERVQKLGSVA